MTIKKLRPTQYFYVLAVIVLVLVVAVLLAGHRHTGNKNSNQGGVFTINGKAYSKKTVSNIIAYALSLGGNKETLSKEAYNYLIREQAAQQLNIVPPSNAINQAELTYFGPKLNSQLKSLSWIKLASYDAALQDELNGNNLSQYQGYSYIFWFGQALETGPAYTVPNVGDQQVVSQDRAYAQKSANYYYNRLKNKTMSPDAVLAAIQKNAKLSFALPNNRFVSQSVQFGLNTSETWQEQVALPDITNYISDQSKPGLSGILTGKIGIVPVPKSPKDYADGYFYIVQLTAAKKIPSVSVSNFTKTVNGIKAYYNGW
jgi:hypothetical protein